MWKYPEENKESLQEIRRTHFKSCQRSSLLAQWVYNFWSKGLSGFKTIKVSSPNTGMTDSFHPLHHRRYKNIDELSSYSRSHTIVINTSRSFPVHAVVHTQYLEVIHTSMSFTLRGNSHFTVIPISWLFTRL